MTAPNLPMIWADLFARSLVENGLRDVVISPGSRSTPYVLACARRPELRITPIVDERSAAFFALGQARMTGRPSLLICTSGTAGAHYYPAVIEAAESRTPLLILTADRPPELHGRDASQTIDQANLYGNHARLFLQIGLPEEDPRALRGLRSLVARAMHACRDPEPGPVHLNAWLRKPLEPQPGGGEEDEMLRERIEMLTADPPTVARAAKRVPDWSAIEEIARLCRDHPRGAIVCGPALSRSPGAAEPLEMLAAVTGYPVFPESGSGYRFGVPWEEAVRCNAFPALCLSETFRRRFRPDLVLQIGRTPVSSGWERMTADADGEPVPLCVFAEHGWQDPGNRARFIVAGDPAESLSVLLETLVLDVFPRDPAWAEAIRAADRLAWEVVDDLLRDSGGTISEAQAVRGVVESLPEGSVLVLGNSLPIREVDFFCPGTPRRIDVLVQRGAAGIDGMVSGALGAGSVAGRPVVLLTGDQGFLHDLHGICVAREREETVAIVVLNNRGGRIFEQLPLHDVPGTEDAVRDLFVVEDLVDFHGVAKTFGIPYQRVCLPSDLPAALDVAFDAGMPSIVEIGVDPASAAADRARLVERLDAKLRERFPDKGS